MTVWKYIRCCRVFPTAVRKEPQRTPLSILDATVARFTPTSAVWMFDGLPKGVTEAVFLQTLQDSFTGALDAVPQWAGQLRWADVRPGGDHTERFGRPVIDWGCDADPGAEWNIVRHPFRLDSVVPTSADRSAGPGIWKGDGFPRDSLISPTPLALHNLVDYEGLPALTVQINLFAEDSGYAIGVKISHVLADAQTLLVFVDLWAAKSRALFGSSASGPSVDLNPRIKGTPIFDPSQLDSRAAGDIDGPGPDPKLSAKARGLPLHRYDWWDTGAPGFEPAFVPGIEASKPTQEQLSPSEAAAAVTTETRAPWHTWNPWCPTGYALLHFRADELEGLKKSAITEAESQNRISRLDALLAHLFRTITRARARVHDYSREDEVFLNVTLDARRRVEPPLPETFLGSPLFLTHIKAKAGSLVSGSDPSDGDASKPGTLGQLARDLRRTMGLFTPDVVAAFLHDSAHEPAPQRLWQGFLGARHLIVTSWMRLPLYDIDFVGGNGESRPRYVHPNIVPSDGIVLVTDSPVEEGALDVALYIDQEVLGKLLDKVEELRKFRV